MSRSELLLSAILLLPMNHALSHLTPANGAGVSPTKVRGVFWCSDRGELRVARPEERKGVVGWQAPRPSLRSGTYHPSPPTFLISANGAVPSVAVVALALPLAETSGQEKEIGEFSIPEVLPLNDRQLAKLRSLIRNDKEAQAIAGMVKERAAPLLGGHATPLEVIHYEGLVNTNPQRVASVKKLRQMTDAAILLRYWQATGDKRAAATLQSWILAWADRYQPTGNDVNDNKLYPLLISYHSLRDQFSDEEKRAVDQWVERFGQLHEKAVKNSRHFTNRYSKHLRLLALAGLILDRPIWRKAAQDGVKRFVRQSLRPDGTSLDLERRDSLGYHGSALRPPMELAILAGDDGPSLYRWQSEKGGSLKKSVDYMIPYALGEKIHREWVHTKVDLDRRRAAAGLEKYRTGKPYDPQDALPVMERGAYFDPGLMRVVRHLSQSQAQRFPTWTTLTNAAAQLDDPADE